MSVTASTASLCELMSAPAGMHAAIVSRIKVIGKMDIAERRLPQEGRVHVVAEGREIDLRVSSMPTLLGEKIVMRILDKSNLTVSLEELGLEAEQLATLPPRMFNRRHTASRSSPARPAAARRRRSTRSLTSCRRSIATS